jgi:hypothetical protein
MNIKNNITYTIGLYMMHFFFCIFYIIGFIKLNSFMSKKIFYLFSLLITNIIMFSINLFYEKYIYVKIINTYNVKLYNKIFNVRLILLTILTIYINTFEIVCPECSPPIFISIFSFSLIGSIGIIQDKKYNYINLIFLFISEFILYTLLTCYIDDFLI